MNRMIKVFFLSVSCNLVMIVFLIAVHCVFEGRTIPSTSMQPNIQIGDRIIIEKVSRWTGKMFERGAIICFFPPPSEMPGGHDLSADFFSLLGRWTNLPIFPTYPVYIKRIVGLPGDRIRVEKGVGVFLNDKLLSEPFVAEPPNYSLSTLADISGRSTSGELIHPYGDSTKQIVVPDGMMFLLGDNRNSSEDSHIFGFVPEDRTIGRAWTIWQPIWQYMHTPYWKRSGN